MKIKDLIKHLQTYDENDTVASSIWLAEDVLSIAHELGKTLSRQQANEALNFIERKQDANVGINWDIIKDAIDCQLES